MFQNVGRFFGQPLNPRMQMQQQPGSNGLFGQEPGLLFDNGHWGNNGLDQFELGQLFNGDWGNWNAPIPDQTQLPDQPKIQQPAKKPQEMAKPQNSLTLSQIQYHQQSAQTLSKALDPLKDKKVFDTIAGKDGKINKDDIQKAQKGFSAFGLSVFGKDSAKVREALQTLQKDNNFETAAGQSGTMTLDQVRTTQKQQQQKADGLKDLATQKGFAKADRNNDHLLSHSETLDSANPFQASDINGVDNGKAMGSGGSKASQDKALQWMGKDGNFYKMVDPNSQDGVTGNLWNQDNIGDCWFLSSVDSLSQTEKGRDVLQKSIEKRPDGSYDVHFAGAPDQTYHVTEADLRKKNYARGDKDVQILAAAADQHFDGKLGDGGYEKDALNLLAGKQGKVEDISLNNKKKVLGGLLGSRTKRKSPEEIKKSLLDVAPHLGKDMALTASGDVGDDGYVSWGSSNHAVAITKIDKASGMVTYHNPWNPDQERTVSIDDMAKQLSEGDANSPTLVKF